MAKCAARNISSRRLGSAFEGGDGVSRSREIRGEFLPWCLGTSSGHFPHQYEAESRCEIARQPLSKKIETDTCKEGSE